MKIKPLTMAFVISCIFVFTACNHIYVDGYRVNFDEWRLAEYDFDPFPEGISFTPGQNSFATDTEQVYANLILTMVDAPYTLRYGHAELIKLINNEWRHVPWSERFSIIGPARVIVNDYVVYHFPDERRSSHPRLPLEFLRYGFIPGTYRFVAPRIQLRRLDLIDDIDIIRSIIEPNATDEEWEKWLPYIRVPFPEYEIVWEGTLWTENFTIVR